MAPDPRAKVATRAIVLSFVLAAYPLLYVGMRAGHLLVRTSEAIDSTGLPSRWSNRILPGRGLGSIAWTLLGMAGWYVFYPAHQCETWYRNRPEYFFRNSRP